MTATASRSKAAETDALELADAVDDTPCTLWLELLEALPDDDAGAD